MSKHTPPVPFELRQAPVAYTHFIYTDNLVVPCFDAHEFREHLYEYGRAFEYQQHDYVDGDFKLVPDWVRLAQELTRAECLQYVECASVEGQLSDAEFEALVEMVESKAEAFSSSLDAQSYVFMILLGHALLTDAPQVVRELAREGKLAIGVDH